MEVFEGLLVYQDSWFNKLLLDIGFYDSPMKVSGNLKTSNVKWGGVCEKKPMQQHKHLSQSFLARP